jgi:hypothetical protein
LSRISIDNNRNFLEDTGDIMELVDPIDVATRFYPAGIEVWRW